MCENNELIAWAAGLFEGEGCINIYQPKNQRYPIAGLSLAMTDEDLVLRFALAVGIEKITESRPVPSNKPIFTWKTRKRSEVDRILNLFLPYLGNRRRQKALEVLSAPSSGRRWGEGPRAGEYAFYNNRRNSSGI